MSARLDTIEHRCNAATEGPWGVGEAPGMVRVEMGQGGTTWAQDVVAWVPDGQCGRPQARARGAFIAHARADVLDLVAVARAALLLSGWFGRGIAVDPHLSAQRDSLLAALEPLLAEE